MHGMITRLLACFLVVCILVVGGLASAQSISHESHHNTHHQKATHSTSLCTWMCAAGNVLDAISAPELTERSPVALSDHLILQFPPHITLDSEASRGPPAFSTK